MPIETKNEFMARHGTPERSPDERLWYFPDGATLNEFDGGFHASEPSPDDRERLEIIRDYWRAVLQRIADQLRRLKAVIGGRSPVFQWDPKLGNLPHGLDAPGMAEFLVGLAADPKAKLQEAEAALAALPTSQVETERERRLKRALARRQLRLQEQQNRVLQSTI